MLSHLSLGVRDLDRAASFYEPALASLGVVQVWRSARGIGYGPPGGQDKLALFQQEAPDALCAVSRRKESRSRWASTRRSKVRTGSRNCAATLRRYVRYTSRVAFAWSGSDNGTPAI